MSRIQLELVRRDNGDSVLKTCDVHYLAPEMTPVTVERDFLVLEYTVTPAAVIAPCCLRATVTYYGEIVSVNDHISQAAGDAFEDGSLCVCDF
jgi:hypothetical protein